MLDNYLNPLMLRELRQNVRNNAVVILINFFIGVLVFSCVISILFSNDGTGIGRRLFTAISALTNAACFIIVVIFSGAKTFRQRKENDLMFTSALPPWSLITGKWLAGAVMTLLLLSLSAPFVAVAYLLRGVDIQNIFLFFLNAFISIQLLNAAGISFASMPQTSKSTPLFVFTGVVIAMYFGTGIIFLPLTFAHSGGTFAMMSAWILEALYVVLFLSLTLLFLLIGSAALSPPTSNRLLPVRVMAAAEFLLSLALLYFSISLSVISPSITINTWFFLGTMLTVLILILTVHEREQWCFRIRRTIPKNFLLRLLYFPFYTGSPCGIIWTVLLYAAVLSVFAAVSPTSVDAKEIFPAIFTVLFTFNYCVTAMLILKKFDPHRKIPVFGLALILLLVFTFGSFILAFLFFASPFDILGNEFYTAYKNSPLSALNPFMLFDNYSSEPLIQWAGAVIWFIALIPFFTIWFIRRVRHFTPAGSDDAMTLKQAVEAVRQTEEQYI